jgi:hypothetical protein
MRVALLLGLMLVAPAAALAQAPAGDSVTGTAASGEARSHVTYTFDVHSGAEGENPTGTVTLDTFFGVIGPLQVGCLSVTGNRAGMIALAPPGSTNVAGLAISVQDGGPGQDQIDFTTLTELPDGCPPPSAPGSPTDSGDVVVTDSPPPPTVYAQCRQAGWVKYGFDSRAACNAYVHDLARRKCIFERVAHGIVAFRAKYGLGPDQNHAMRHCVRLYTGW